MRIAQNIANSLGGAAYPAYSLINYDKELKNSMEYVFGNTVIINYLLTKKEQLNNLIYFFSLFVQALK